MADHPDEADRKMRAFMAELRRMLRAGEIHIDGDETQGRIELEAVELPRYYARPGEVVLTFDFTRPGDRRGDPANILHIVVLHPGDDLPDYRFGDGKLFGTYYRITDTLLDALRARDRTLRDITIPATDYIRHPDLYDDLMTLAAIREGSLAPHAASVADQLARFHELDIQRPEIEHACVYWWRAVEAERLGMPGAAWRLKKAARRNADVLIRENLMSTHMWLSLQLPGPRRMEWYLNLCVEALAGEQMRAAIERIWGKLSIRLKADQSNQTGYVPDNEKGES